MSKSILANTALASSFMFLLVGACTDQNDVQLDEAIDATCEDDAKCDGQTAEGFEVFKGADNRYYFHLQSANGRIVLQSQSYATKQAATKGVESVRSNGVDAANYKLMQASSGQWYVNLLAQNHEIIATTETYTRKFSAQRAIETSVALTARAQQVRAAKSGAKFQTFIGADHQRYFHLRGKNGEVMLASEGYVNGASAIKAIASVRTNGKIAGQYNVLQAADGQWFFNLRAGNGEIIGHGETYASKTNAQRAVDTLVALLKSELVANPAPIAAPARSVTTFPVLQQTFGALSDVAAGGATLAYFGFAETSSAPAGLQCSNVTLAQLGEVYDGLVDEVQTSGNRSARPDLTQAMIDSGRAEFLTLLGTDSYKLCTTNTTRLSTLGAETYIQASTASGPRLVLELGFNR